MEGTQIDSEVGGNMATVFIGYSQRSIGVAWDIQHWSTCLLPNNHSPPACFLVDDTMEC